MKLLIFILILLLIGYLWFKNRHHEIHYTIAYTTNEPLIIEKTFSTQPIYNSIPYTVTIEKSFDMI